MICPLTGRFGIAPTCGGVGQVLGAFGNQVFIFQNIQYTYAHKFEFVKRYRPIHGETTMRNPILDLPFIFNIRLFTWLF